VSSVIPPVREDAESMLELIADTTCGVAAQMLGYASSA